MNKNGQVQAIVVITMVILGLIIAVPIILKVGTTVLGTFSTQLSNIDETNKSSDQVTFVEDTITGSFDWVVMLLVLINILLLLVSAFLIDVNPAFVILYIIFAFVLVITLPYTASVGEKIYSMSQFSVGDENVVQYLPMTEFLLNHFGVVMVGIIFLSGVIIYAKIRFRSNQQGGGTSY